MMDSDVPEWLTSTFLKQCLQKKYGNNDIEVQSHIVSSVVPPGNNYGSFIVRVKVEYKTNTYDPQVHSLSLILKSELTEGGIKDVMDNQVDLQKTEHHFYYKFLPKAEQLTDVGFAPNSFFSPLNSVTILEDLREKGYKMADRTRQLDFKHCCLYMEAAASMHAVSFVVQKKDPEVIELLSKEKMFSNENTGHELFINLIKGGMEAFADAAEKFSDSKKYAKTIREVAPILWEAIIKIHKPSDKINTINQGDPWTTNMMFKYDEMHNVSGIKLIDFQCLRFASPINDLVFFIWSSANNYVKSCKLGELYQIYQDTFNSKLEQLNCKERLTSEYLSSCLKKVSPLAVFQVACMLPLLVHPDPIDFGKFLPKDKENNEEIVLTYYKDYYNETYSKEQVPLSIVQLEKAGVFQDLENLIE